MDYKDLFALESAMEKTLGSADPSTDYRAVRKEINASYERLAKREAEQQNLHAQLEQAGLLDSSEETNHDCKCRLEEELNSLLDRLETLPDDSDEMARLMTELADRLLRVRTYNRIVSSYAYSMISPR